MRLTILGSGASAGVPLIGCDCAVCVSDDPKNKRRRVSLLIEEAGQKILVDTSPDLRAQALDAGIKTVDAILYTHAHADHVHGIDEVRSFNYNGDQPIPAFGNAATFAELRERFGYAFEPKLPQYGWFRPCIEVNEIVYNQPFCAGGVEFVPFEQTHGHAGEVIGFRTGNVAYSVDVKSFPDASLPYLEGLDVWIVDCLTDVPVPTHADLELVLSWVERFKPKRTILTHMSHVFDYHQLREKLPPNVEPAFDNMVVNI